MKNLLKKKLNKKGFTLAELLIVVAIIAVLVAIAIPVFTSALGRAQNAVIVANGRSCKSEAAYSYLMKAETTNKTYFYSVGKTGDITEIEASGTVTADDYVYMVKITAPTGTAINATTSVSYVTDVTTVPTESATTWKNIDTTSLAG